MIENGPSDDEREIRQLLEDYTEAMHHKDARTACAHYSDDLVAFDLAPPLCVGGADATDARAMQAWLDTWRELETRARELRVHVAGDVAFAYTLQRMRGMKRDGQEVELWFRATCGLRKEKGSWKIVHLHNSVPFYMDGSERAALDLRP